MQIFIPSANAALHDHAMLKDSPVVMPTSTCRGIHGGGNEVLAAKSVRHLPLSQRRGSASPFKPGTLPNTCSVDDFSKHTVSMYVTRC